MKFCIMPLCQGLVVQLQVRVRRLVLLGSWAKWLGLGGLWFVGWLVFVPGIRFSVPETMRRQGLSHLKP